MHPEDKEACIKLTAIYVLLFVFCYYLTTLMQP